MKSSKLLRIGREDVDKYIKKLKRVAEAAKTVRQLQHERLEITKKLVRKEITKDFWIEHGAKHARKLENAETELDKALLALETEGEPKE